MDIDPQENILVSAFSKLAEGIEEEPDTGFAKYADNPVGFITEVLQEDMWPALEEIANSVRDNRYTAVKSANSVGKTWVAARIVLWWLNCFSGGASCKIITTAAPPERQIKELLWGEIRTAWRKAKERGVNLVGKTPGVMALRVNENSWAQGFTIPSSGTSEERITRFQGHHAEHLLFILDEAYGIPREIFEAMDSCLAGGHNHALLLSNPMLAFGDFYNAFTDEKYHTITVSAFDHPNVVSGKNKIPGSVTREVTEDRIKKWSRPLQADEVPDASCFEVPQYFGGSLGGQIRKVTFPMLDVKTLARFPTQSEKALFNATWIEAARKRWYEKEPIESPGRLSADVAEYGVDANCVFIRRENGWVSRPIRWNGIDPIKTGGRITSICREHGIDEAYIDAIGVGAGVPAHLIANGIKNTFGVKVSEAANSKSAEGQQFALLRDQLYWALREWLRTDPNATLPPDGQLLQELSVMTYDIDFRGKIVVMRKEGDDGIKKIISRSPDSMEALMLSFYTEKVWKDLSFVKV